MEVLFNDKTAVSRAGKGSAAGVVGAGSPAGVVGAGSAAGVIGAGSAAGVVGAGSAAGVVGAGSAAGVSAAGVVGAGSCNYLNYISAAFYYMLLSKSSICWFWAATNAAKSSCLRNIKLNLL